MNKKNIAFVFGLLFFGLALSAPAHADAPELAYLINITKTNFLPSTITANDFVSLAIDVKNAGTSLPIVDLNSQLDVGNRFELIKGSDFVPHINPGTTQTIIFQFRVKPETVAGYYPIFMTMNYLRAGVLTTQTQTISIPVSITGKNIDVTIEPKVINPSNQTQLIFSLRNISDSPVSNISFSWSEKNNLILPLGSDNKRYVSFLDSNQTTTVSYMVAADPNITTGVYPLDVTMTFIDSNGTKTKTSQVGLIVGGTTDFEVSAEMLSSGQLSISVANIGSNNAGAVIVKIPPQPRIAVSGSNISILGNLNKGDFTIANFTLRGFGTSGTINSGSSNFPTAPDTFRNQQSSDRNAPANELTVQIDYTDTTGQRQTVQKTIQLSANFFQNAGGMDSMHPRQRANPFSLLPWILLILIVGGAIAFNHFKTKNKKWKELALPLGIAAIAFLAIIFLAQADLTYSIIMGVVSAGYLLWYFRKKLER